MMLSAAFVVALTLHQSAVQQARLGSSTVSFHTNALAAVLQKQQKVPVLAVHLLQ